MVSFKLNSNDFWWYFENYLSNLNLVKIDSNEKIFGIVLHASQCANNCVFCGSKKMGDIEKNIKKELDKIDLILEKGEPINKIEISGNDPGEYERLPDFISSVKAKTGASEIILATHGKKLSDKKFLKEIVKSGVNHFLIPFYGHMPKIHDSITQTEGSFEETLAGVRNIYVLNQNVSYRCLITRENQEYLNEFFYFLSKLPFYKFSCVGIPCYVKGKEKFTKSIPNFLKLRVQLSNALKLCKYINFNLRLIDIPRCLINFYFENIMESGTPYEAYEYLKGGKKDLFSIENGQVIPEYRVKKKIKLCGKCIYNNLCPGFFKTYVDSKLFPFRPILRKEK